MKKPFILALIATALTFGACEKSRDEIYAPSSKIEGINATWVLAEVHQYDPKDIEKENVLDVSEMFTDRVIELTVNSQDFTYTFNGTDPLYIGTSGIWAFDNNEAPSRIHFKNINSNNDTLKYDCGLIRTVRTVDATLEFELTRYCESGTTPTTIYQYKFRRK
jgi:hypothetical protein